MFFVLLTAALIGLVGGCLATLALRPRREGTWRPGRSAQRSGGSAAHDAVTQRLIVARVEEHVRSERALVEQLLNEPAQPEAGAGPPARGT